MRRFLCAYTFFARADRQRHTHTHACWTHCLSATRNRSRILFFRKAWIKLCEAKATSTMQVNTFVQVFATEVRRGTDSTLTHVAQVFEVAPLRRKQIISKYQEEHEEELGEKLKWSAQQTSKAEFHPGSSKPFTTCYRRVQLFDLARLRRVRVSRPATPQCCGAGWPGSQGTIFHQALACCASVQVSSLSMLLLNFRSIRRSRQRGW